jgi:hypothetical protein
VYICWSTNQHARQYIPQLTDEYTEITNKLKKNYTGDLFPSLFPRVPHSTLKLNHWFAPPPQLTSPHTPTLLATAHLRLWPMLTLGPTCRHRPRRITPGPEPAVGRLPPVALPVEEGDFFSLFYFELILFE